jgi:hypothetical protein
VKFQIFVFSNRHDTSTHFNLLIQLNTWLAWYQMTLTLQGKRRLVMAKIRARIRKIANSSMYVSSVLDPPLYVSRSATVCQSFPSSLVWSSCSLLTAFHSMKSLSDKQRELRTSLQVYLCNVTSLQTCLSPQRELFSPYPFALRISKTDMQHSITVFSQTCLTYSHTLSLSLSSLLSEAFSIKDSRNALIVRSSRIYMWY